MNLLQRLSHYLPFTDSAKRQKENCFSADYLVIDLELTGLNAKIDEIVSIAWVPIKNQRIYLGQGCHFINNQVNELKQSPIYHGIDRSLLANGNSLTSILAQMQPLLTQYHLVFHNAALDWAFLTKAFNQAKLELPKLNSLLLLDTMMIEHKRLQRQGTDIKSDALTLANCRNRYHLPQHQAHNALTDAVATAELFLAQINHISKGQSLLVKQLI